MKKVKKFISITEIADKTKKTTYIKVIYFLLDIIE